MILETFRVILKTWKGTVSQGTAQGNQRTRFIPNTDLIGQCPQKNLCFAFYINSFSMLQCLPRIKNIASIVHLVFFPCNWTDILGIKYLISTETGPL